MVRVPNPNPFTKSSVLWTGSGAPITLSHRVSDRGQFSYNRARVYGLTSGSFLVDLR